MDDASISVGPTSVPPVLGTFLRGCLEKDSRKRVRDIGDVRLAMAGAFDVPAPPIEPRETAVSVRRLHVWQRPIPAAIVGLALLVFGGARSGV